MTEALITKDHPYKKDGYLRNQRGAIAKILEVVERQKPYHFKCLRVEITESNGEQHNATILPLALKGWTPTTEAPKPQPVEQVAAPVVVKDQAELRELIGLPAENHHNKGMLENFFREEAARQDTLETDASDTAAAEAVALVKEAADPIYRVIEQLQTDLDATRQALAFNHREYEKLTSNYFIALEDNKKLEAENEALKETAQSAIEHDAAGSDHRAEIADSAYDYDNDLADFQNWQKAQEQAAKPCHEYKTIIAISDADLAKNEREGWEVWHKEFVTDAKLNVVYIRAISVHTPAPIPHQTVKAVGPHFIMPAPHTAPAKAEEPVSVGDLPTDERKARYQAIMRNPDLTSDEKTQLMNADLVEHGAQVYQEAIHLFTQPVRSLAEIAHHD